MSGTSFRTAVAAILAGLLVFAGQGGELAFSSSDDGDAVFVALGVAGIVALGVAFWGLREIVSGTRRGRIGIRLALAGFALLALFAIQVIAEQIRTGEIPENFILFALGFLLVTVGQLLFARDLRPTIGRAWVLPLVAGRWPGRRPHRDGRDSRHRPLRLRGRLGRTRRRAAASNADRCTECLRPTALDTLRRTMTMPVAYHPFA